MRKEYSQYFITKKRHANDQSFTCLKDNAPQELKDLVQQIHFDYFCKCLPNDWIYQTISEAFFELADNDFDDITLESDAYNCHLTSWLNDNCNQYATEYCNEILQDYYPRENNINIIEIIRLAQVYAKDRIYYAVNEFINEGEENNG